YGRRGSKPRGEFARRRLAVFVVAAYAGRQFPQTLNGSLIYAPAVLVIAWLGVYHYRTHTGARHSLLAAAVVFLVGVFFRTIDSAVCPAFPVGTHFLWHLLIPVALYLLMR